MYLNKSAIMSLEYMKIGLVVITYWAISISLVFGNKYLVGNSKSKHNVALYTAWIQCIVTVLVVLFITFVKAVYKKDLSILKLNISKATSPQIIILSCTYVCMLAFNNLCLRYVGVAFYQVARSLTLIFVVIFSLLILKKPVSYKIWICCFIIGCGFGLGVDQENLSGTLSIAGVVFGISTSLFVSLNGIFTKTALDIVDRDSLQLTLLNNINAIILFIPYMVITGQLQTALSEPEYHTYSFCIFLVFTGILAFAISWISAVQIDLTSPVTHHISANLKAVLQTVIAVTYNSEHKGYLWWVSVAMVIGGALTYALVRIQEDRGQKSENLGEHADKC